MLDSSAERLALYALRYASEVGEFEEHASEVDEVIVTVAREWRHLGHKVQAEALALAHASIAYHEKSAVAAAQDFWIATHELSMVAKWRDFLRMVDAEALA
jgi:hypothetical protein